MDVPLFVAVLLPLEDEKLNPIVVTAYFRFDTQKRGKTARQVPRLDMVHLRLSGGEPVTVIVVIRGVLNVFLSAEAHAGFAIFVC